MTPWVSKKLDPELQEVCYGHIKVKAHVYNVPTPSSRGSEGSDNWPTIRCGLARRKDVESGIRVYDPCGIKVGWISDTRREALTQAMDTIGGLRLQAYLPRRAKIGREHSGHACDSYIELIINLYGPRNEAIPTGRIFGRTYCWIKPPMSPDAGVPICNPHRGRYHLESLEWPEGSAPEDTLVTTHAVTTPTVAAAIVSDPTRSQGAAKGSEKETVKPLFVKNISNFQTHMFASRKETTEQPTTPASFFKRKRTDDTSEATRFRDDQVAKLSSDKVKLIFENGDLTKRLGDHVLETARVLLKNDQLAEELIALTEEKAEFNKRVEDLTQEKEGMRVQIDDLAGRTRDLVANKSQQRDHISEQVSRNHALEVEIQEKDKRIENLTRQKELLKTKWEKVNALMGGEEDDLP